ncbi:MAG: phosphohistidine phosphatase SixA [Ignavibacteriae bacterium]|nr:phosphohistidine phosphatase SixA [Ignavibacteriota bacterium]
MHIYLLRHCDAAEFSPDDVTRPLSEKGESQARTVGRVLQKLNIVPDAIISSPYARARQTSEIVQEELRLEKTSVSEFLVPGCDPRQMIHQLNGQENSAPLLVGHEPQLRALLSQIISASTMTDILFTKGSLGCLSVLKPIISGKGTLHWLLTNEQMQLF